jgi:hypothetical protein
MTDDTPQQFDAERLIEQEMDYGEPIQHYPELTEPGIRQLSSDDSLIPREMVVLAFFGGLVMGVLLARAFGGSR